MFSILLISQGGAAFMTTFKSLFFLIQIKH